MAEDEITQADYNKLLNSFFEQFSYFSLAEREKIAAAWELLCECKGEEARESGEPFVLHFMRVAEILGGLSLDADTIAAAFLHGIDSEAIASETLSARLGKAAASLIEGARQLSALQMKPHTIKQAETARKMLFALVDDARVILISLADRLDKMRHLASFPQGQQKALAQEAADIWAPLANRLGIAAIKDELEDLSLKFSNREVFDYIKRLVAAKKSERASFLESAAKKIEEEASKASIKVEVYSRAKHFWSIYQKMKRRGKDASELYDLLAVRIICDTAAECYLLVGIIHSLWKPLEGRFKDYIAMPKPNGYQSLHTTVICGEGRPLEIQIRTAAMHKLAENGIASHWLYKRGASREVFSAKSIPVINRMKELVESHAADEDFLAELKRDILGNSIFVFTPKGDVIELPEGSTAIDFAYAIHSAIGEKISAAKADGAIIPLSRPLKNTQVIEIITHPQAHPTVNQYNSARTSKARQKIRAYLNESEHASKQEHRTTKKEAAKPENNLTVKSDTPLPDGERSEKASISFSSRSLKIRIENSTKYLIKFARCCNPEPPDAVIGYVSRGRGVIIHRKDCSNLCKIPEAESRLISVEWAE